MPLIKTFSGFDGLGCWCSGSLGSYCLCGIQHHLYLARCTQAPLLSLVCFFFALEKWFLEQTKSLWMSLEKLWFGRNGGLKFCAAGNDETLIKPCDFGGGVASGLKQLSAACLQEFLTSYLLTSYQVPTISWVPWQNNKIENTTIFNGHVWLGLPFGIGWHLTYIYLAGVFF